MADDLALVRLRIHGVQQLDAVIGAMRGIAAAHAQQSRALLPGFRAYATVIAQAIGEALRLRHNDGRIAVDGTNPRRGQIVFCAEQGFAGNLSEHVMEVARTGPEPDVVLLVGSRGWAVLDGTVPSAWRTTMATQVGGIAPLCTRIAEALYRLLPEHRLGAVEVVFPVWQPGEGLHVQHRSLLPLDETRFRLAPGGVPPLTTLPPQQLLEDLAAEYVYAELCDVAMHAFMAENEARVAAMLRARNNVQDMLARLRSSERQVRQEAITAELIELVGAIERAAVGAGAGTAPA
jgi:F-type H+-transporting ATPase subunit gamma